MSSVLDDLKMIHERDAQDALGVAEKQWQQLEQEFSAPTFAGEITNVVLGGMGGSALYGLMANGWPGVNVPFEIVRGYNIPAYVSDKTLFIASSHSGDTEETLAALAEAEAKHAQIVVLASGGKLADIARDKGYPLMQLPADYQPRYTIWFGLKALVTIFEAAGLTQGKMAELVAARDWLQQTTAAWIPTAPTAQNPAKQIAQELVGKSVVIYSGPKLFPATYKWKISLNENAKHVAWCNQYPEFNHNEFIGWTKQPVQKPYAVVELRSPLEHERVQKRFVVSERLLSGMRPAPIVVVPQGETLLQQLMWSVALGDFVSLYTALLNGINPTPVDLIEKFKKSLDE
jgi:glucose/mannose-6-phosphate isomerase